MIVENKATSCLVDEFFASGGKVRKMPMGATATRPSSMRREDRDAYIASRRNYSAASRRNYLAIPQIHHIEAMIDRRATRDEIADYLDKDPADILALTEKLEHSGIAYPEYLRKSMETPFDVLHALRITNPRKTHIHNLTRQSQFRDLTDRELRAFEDVRSGVNATVAVNSLGIRYETFIGLISKRFGCVSELRKYKTNRAMLDRIAVFATQGAS